MFRWFRPETVIESNGGGLLPPSLSQTTLPSEPATRTVAGLFFLGTSHGTNGRRAARAARREIWRTARRKPAVESGERCGVRPPWKRTHGGLTPRRSPPRLLLTRPLTGLGSPVLPIAPCLPGLRPAVKRGPSAIGGTRGAAGREGGRANAVIRQGHHQPGKSAPIRLRQKGRTHQFQCRTGHRAIQPAQLSRVRPWEGTLDHESYRRESSEVPPHSCRRRRSMRCAWERRCWWRWSACSRPRQCQRVELRRGELRVLSATMLRRPVLLPRCTCQMKTSYKLVYDTVLEKRWTTCYQTVQETVMKQVCRTCYRDECKTCYKTVPHDLLQGLRVHRVQAVLQDLLQGSVRDRLQAVLRDLLQGRATTPSASAFRSAARRRLLHRLQAGLRGPLPQGLPPGLQEDLRAALPRVLPDRLQAGLRDLLQGRLLHRLQAVCETCYKDVCCTMYKDVRRDLLQELRQDVCKPVTT